MNYIGMDVHRSQTTFCVVDDAGAVMARGRVDSSEEGWSTLVTRWPADQVAVALETGLMAWRVVDVVRGVGVEPVVVDARAFKVIASSKKKSDRRDAFHLADARRTGLAERCAVVVPSERARRGRALLQARATVVRQWTSARNAAVGLLGSIGIRTAKRRWRDDGYWVELQQQYVIPDWLKALVEVHRSVLKAAQVERARLDQAVKDELGLWPEAKQLDQIPGYGPVVTLGVLSSIDDPRRFSRQRQVASYAGMPPTVRDSGDSIRRGGVTKQGRKLLRVLMVQAAYAAMNSRLLVPHLKTWARKLMLRRGRQVAAVALGRKLLLLGYRILLTGEPYNPLPRPPPLPA